MKNLHKITRLKREDGIMSFVVRSKKYEEKIDYSLMWWEQVENILDTELLMDSRGGTLHNTFVIF